MANEPKSTVKEILSKKGLKIQRWETVKAGLGLEWIHPVIVDKKTGERILTQPTA